MNKDNRNVIVIVLLTLVFVVWGLAIAGWAKSASGSFTLFKKSNSDTPKTQIIEETTSLESPEQTPASQELDASGVWDMTFHRYYFYENEGSWESIGTEEVFLWMEIYPGKPFECDIMPYEGTINGESYADYLAAEPRRYTGEVVGNTLRLYLDLDDFYLGPSLEVSDTILPDYIEIPITEENGLPSGNYDYTWVAVVDDYNLQSRVTIELSKR